MKISNKIYFEGSINDFDNKILVFEYGSFIIVRIDGKLLGGLVSGIVSLDNDYIVITGNRAIQVDKIEKLYYLCQFCEACDCIRCCNDCGRYGSFKMDEKPEYVDILEEIKKIVSEEFLEKKMP